VLDLAVIATVFALVFVSELPDKTAVAGLMLGTRFPICWVFAGMAAAFLTHVLVAVAAGRH
jgi:Ca2+/H+ antiporter, TMEM165/GDT1 family